MKVEKIANRLFPKRLHYDYEGYPCDQAYAAAIIDGPTEERTSDKAINDDVYNCLLVGRGDCDGTRQK